MSEREALDELGAIVTFAGLPRNYYSSSDRKNRRVEVSVAGGVLIVLTFEDDIVDVADIA